MERDVQNKIVLITRKTRLEELLLRHNTMEQAKFFIERMNLDFFDYVLENSIYKKNLEIVKQSLYPYGRVQIVERTFLPSLILGKNDTVVVLGQDGLVANTLKYTENQSVIGVNPDPDRWDGVLLPFVPDDVGKIIKEVQERKRPIKDITFAKVEMNDGQTLLGVNDIFVGQKSHVSARYQICIDGHKENQSSSGIIISTGLGSTGWLKSILAGAAGVYSNCNGKDHSCIMQPMEWNEKSLRFTVREPYPSTSTQAGIVFGTINDKSKMVITSYMSENGVIFSDGMESDCIEFNSGAVASVGVAETIGHLVQ